MKMDPKFELFKLVINDYSMDETKKYELCKEIFLSGRTTVMPIPVPLTNEPNVPEPVRPTRPVEVPAGPVITYASNTTEDKTKEQEINK